MGVKETLSTLVISIMNTASDSSFVKVPKVHFFDNPSNRRLLCFTHGLDAWVIKKMKECRNNLSFYVCTAVRECVCVSFYNSPHHCSPHILFPRVSPLCLFSSLVKCMSEFDSDFPLFSPEFTHAKFGWLEVALDNLFVDGKQDLVLSAI